jgi:thioredoxin reductase (NADPH)
MITPDLLKDIPLFAEVPAAELSTIAARAADIHLRVGEWLIHEGEAPAFFILLSGRIEVFKSFGGTERQINTYLPGTFSGEIPLLLGSASIASLQASEASRVCRLDEHDFRQLIAACPKLNAELLRTMATRLGYLQQAVLDTPVATVTIIGHRFDLACHDLRDFLARNRVLFRWHDPRDPEARVGMAAEPQADETYPVVVLPDGSRLITPSFREVAERLGLGTVPAESSYDVIIVGGGPAGLAAAVYGASEGLCMLLIEREAPGGQAGTSSRIENYLGFPTGISGDDLGLRALKQATRFGVEIIVARDVVGIESDFRGNALAVVLDGGDRVETRSVVIASGVAWRELEVVGADRMVGRGIYYGAARTEALNTRGRDIFLIGGGNSAGQAAMFFANYARTVTLLVRGPSLVASMSHYLIAQLETKSNVKIEVLSQVVGVEGTDHLEAIVIEDRRNGQRRHEPTDALFVFIGADAKTEWLPPAVICDERGYVCTGRDVTDLVAQQHGSWPIERDPYLLETSVPGIFAVGDVRHGSIKRVASGVGEGSMAIAFVHQYLSERQDSLESSDPRRKVSRPAGARAAVDAA